MTRTFPPEPSAGCFFAFGAEELLFLKVHEVTHNTSPSEKQHEGGQNGCYGKAGFAVCVCM